MLEVRSARPDDLPVLTIAWHEAGLWRPEELHSRPSVEEALGRTDLARYRWDPTREGDVAVVAVVDGEGIGGAWARLFPNDDPGYGFVDDATPELGIGVVGAWRGRGVGRALLSALLVDLGRAGHRQVSLSVEVDNPSRLLYRQLGFLQVGQEDDGSAVTMLRGTGARTVR
jgi:ribosomal protein S18 acetylase RimI-like enzyme